MRAGLSTAFARLQEKLGEGGTAAAFKLEFRADIEDVLAHAFDLSHAKCSDHCPFKDGSARASKHADAYVSCAGAQKAIRGLLAVYLSDINLDKLIADHIQNLRTQRNESVNSVICMYACVWQPGRSILRRMGVN